MGLEVKIYDTPAGGIHASQGTFFWKHVNNKAEDQLAYGYVQSDHHVFDLVNPGLCYVGAIFGCVLLGGLIILPAIFFSVVGFGKTA